MPKIYEQSLGIVSNPPKVGVGISAVGNVPALQRYDAIANSYEPDYTLTPLTLQIDVAAVDANNLFDKVNARKFLTNIHWYELSAEGSRTEITIGTTGSTPSGYSQLYNNEGNEDAGRLQIAKNAAPGVPIMLQFEADLVTGDDVFHICRNFNVSCRDVTPSVRCLFDVPDVTPYNPIHDADDMGLQLTVWENNGPADPAHFIPVWEARRDDGSWTEYGTEITDYWLEIAADKMSATLHRSLMADGVSVRVRLKYDRYGNPGSVTLAPGDISVPCCRMECLRSFGKYDHHLFNVTNSLAAWVTQIRTEVVFKDNKGDIADPDQYFIVTMYAGQQGKTLSASDIVGTGRIQSIPTQKAAGKGLKVGYTVEEIGPLKALADSDGAVLTDSDGSILLIK